MKSELSNQVNCNGHLLKLCYNFVPWRRTWYWLKNNQKMKSKYGSGRESGGGGGLESKNKRANNVVKEGVIVVALVVVATPL